MKRHVSKKKYLYIVFTVFCIFLCTAAVIAAVFTLPNAISYHPVADSRQTYAVSDTQNKTAGPACEYDSLYDIQEGGPFIIRAEKDGIYVFSESNRLYRINANLNIFPEADKKAVISGIQTDTREQLFEMVQYMES